jgi:hypothetical protein
VELARAVLKQFGKKLAATAVRQFCTRLSRAVHVHLLARTNAHADPLVVILLLIISAILMTWAAPLVSIWLRRGAFVVRPTFTTNRAISSKYTAQRSAARISAVDFTHAKSFAIARENVETHEMAVSRSVERQSYSATIHASSSAMARPVSLQPLSIEL